MSTRFDSYKNNPNSKTLTSKRKVLLEFQNMQQQLKSIHQEHIMPDGEEIFANSEEEEQRTADLLNKNRRPSEDQSDSRALNKVFENEEFFTKREEDRVRDVTKRYQSLEPLTERSHNRRKFGANNNADRDYFTMNSFHQTVVKKRSTGFIDFNKQTNRPAFQVNKAHEHRFQFLDPFPEPVTGSKHVPQFRMEQQLARRKGENIKMSESCFDMQQVDQIRRKLPGTLQFGNSTDSKFMKQRRMQMTEDVNIPDNKIRSPVLTFTKQQARIPNIKLTNKLATKMDERAQNKLPCHMHNVNNRMACNNMLERTLRESKYQMADYLSPGANLGQKKSFRRDLSGSPPPLFDPQRPPKKKSTFQQLLVKFGYITEDKSKEARKRPWHVAPVNFDNWSSSSDDENMGI